MSKKRGLTLDLANAPAKKTRLGVTPSTTAGPSNNASILTTPDVQMLKLSSPELAKFLTGGGASLATPTPSGYVYPKNVKEERELYAKGFEDAAKRTTNFSGGSVATVAVPQATTIVPVTVVTRPTPPPAISFNTATTTTASRSRPSSGASGSVDGNVLIKEENDDLEEEDDVHDSDDSSSQDSNPGSSSKKTKKVMAGQTPINMESQEQLKLERKRQRNRIAASKCRKRKLERIGQLDEKVAALKEENQDLAAVVKKLRESVCNLKQEVMEHAQAGCEIMITQEMSNAML